jgi:Winged helix DNA-binding domain
MSTPVVEAARVRSHLLARQGLTDHWDLGVADTADRVVGVYGTARSGYLSVAARSRRGDVTRAMERALYQDRELVRLRAMRSTVFAVPTATLPWVMAATRPNVERIMTGFLRSARIDPAEAARLGKAIEAELAGGGRLTSRELQRVVCGPEPCPGFRHVVAYLCANGALVRARPRGSWLSDNFEYALLREWLPDFDHGPSPTDGYRWLLHRYLAAFGPATLADFVWWSGVPARHAASALAELSGQVVRCQVTGLSGEHFAIAEDFERLRRAEAAPPGRVVLLPVWDACAMGYRDRGRLVPPEAEAYCYDRSGNCTALVVVDGVAVGVWEFEQRADGALVVAVAAFAPIRWEPVEREADALARRLGLPGAECHQHPGGAVRIKRALGNSFMSPVLLAGRNR